ncbi:MAG: hypothetical protein A2Z84_01390 [Tenericutes bacterium GWA2_35_7]|nr:MAG: hypothetical protein A2Z84_01390 [Tenericutes bacterium GWA2_35_7]OHE38385.1 MAG: hypothetical protein A2Y44_03805 [Tenericutes bacterium GWF2_35_184]OHE42720.1 MAG: hypothetical protein A2221_08435 [Tenericutes bacterium RIFOXYA2_FULL_36_32]
MLKDNEKNMREHLNTNLFFNKMAYGKAIAFDPKKYAASFSKKKRQLFLEKLFNIFRDDLDRSILIERRTKMDINQIPSRKIQMAIDVPEVIELIEMKVLDQQCDFIGSVTASFKVGLQKARHDLLKRVNDIEYKELLHVLQYHIDRINSEFTILLLDDFQNKIEEDFIIVIDKFIKEIFFKPSPFLKAIIYRNKKEIVSFNHYAVHYQLPIKYSEQNIEDGNYVLVDLDESIIVNPTSDDLYVFKEYNALVENQCFIENPYKETNFKINAMISNYMDVDKIQRHPLFQTALLYQTDIVVASKGKSLTYNEWVERFHYILKNFKGEEVFVRFISFNEWVNTQELIGINQFDILRDYPEYVEPFANAIADVSEQYPEKKISILIPNLEFEFDYDLWKYHIECMVEGRDQTNQVRVSYEYDTKQAMYEMEALKYLDDFVINLNSLMASYVEHTVFSRDEVEINTINESNIYRDLQYTRYIMKLRSFKQRCIISGHCAQERSILHRLIIAGYREFMVPASSTNHIYDVIDYYFSRRGQYVGVYYEDIARTEFYRNLKKKAEDPAKFKKRYRLYKKHLEEQKKLEEENKKDDKEKNEDPEDSENNNE